MGKGKSDAKKKKRKSSQLVIRIEASERDAFVKLCDKLDTTAAREIRRFMREWVAQNMPVPTKESPIEAEVETEPPQEAPLPETAKEAAPKPRRKRKEAEVPVA
ncbi:MAG: hypothetical protein JNK34_05235 [Tabrizicola sp.]|nr:hypothetical protein [Tabrizicola sp.]